MPTNRKHTRRVQRSPLNALQEMELWLGVCRIGPTFTSERARRAAWLKHEPRLLERWGRDGKRPWAWWRYSAPLGFRRRFPGTEREKSVLWEAGLLDESERLELEKFWRAEFEKALAPNFSFYKSGKLLSGFKAAVEHLIFIDLPPVLCDKWERELEWRGRRKLPAPPIAPTAAEMVDTLEHGSPRGEDAA